MKHLDLKEIRNEEQRKYYAEIDKKGICPFCLENFNIDKDHEILQENDSWLVTWNRYPYDGTKYHFLLVYKKSHATHPNQISVDDKLDLFNLIDWINSEYKINYGSFVMRYGDEGNGSSVRHLHAHIIVGQSNTKTDKAVRAKIGYGK